MMLPSRLDCPLSLKTPNMGNPGILSYARKGFKFFAVLGEPPIALDHSPRKVDQCF